MSHFRGFPSLYYMKIQTFVKCFLSQNNMTANFEVRWFAEGYGIDIAEWFKQIKLNLNT